MDFKHLRWLFIVPITLFIGIYEWMRHYPLHEFVEWLFPGWRENFFSVIIMLAVIIVFSHKLFVYIEQLDLKLAIEREKLALVFEHSADAILVIGHDKMIKTLNPAATRLLGRQQEDFGSLSCNDVLKCHDCFQKPICKSGCIADHIWITSQSSSAVEINICTKNGQFIPVSISCSEIPSAFGQEDAMVLVIRDIREKKRLDEEVVALTKITDGNPERQSTTELTYSLINKIVDVARVDFAIYTEEKDGKIGQETYAGLKDDLEPAARQKIQQIVQAVLKTGKMEVLSREGTAEPWSAEAGQVEKGLALAAYPVSCCEDTLIGVITCGRFGGSFTVQEMNTMTLMAKQGALIVENHFLYQKVQDGAIIDERYRLAREFHDGLAQGLGYLNLQSKRVADRLQRGDVEQAARELEELRHVIKELYQEARNSILDLKVISVEDITAYLKNYLVQFEKQASVRTKLVLPEETIRLTHKTELHLIRIIQEALANIRKHANATEVQVVATINSESLQVQIIDNGIGFSLPVDVSKHFGLVIMQERAALIGATVSVVAGESSGTVVIIDLPADKGGGEYGTN